MFLILGLQVFPGRLLPIAGIGLLVALFLIFVARPLSVHIALLFSNVSFPEQMLVAGVGLRGAVPIVLATFVLSSHVSGANTIFNAVFFVVLVSAVLQGTTLEWVAKKLGLLVPFAGAEPPLEVTRDWHSLNLVEFSVASGDAIVSSAVRELGLPRDALIAVLVRGDEAIPPRGTTTIQAGDVLFILSPNGEGPELEEVFRRWRRRI
jgi:potassium/hydrogen antiporter